MAGTRYHMGYFNGDSTQIYIHLIDPHRKAGHYLMSISGRTVLPFGVQVLYATPSQLSSSHLRLTTKHFLIRREFGPVDLVFKFTRCCV